MPLRLRIQLTEEEKQELLTLYQQEKVPKRTRQRIDILMFSDGGWMVSKIAKTLRCSEALVRRTITRWINQEKEREWPDKKLEFFFLSAYSHELNEIEPEWHQLKTHELAGRMFEDEYDLSQAVIQAIEDRNERNDCTCDRLRFNSLSNSQELS